VIRDIPAAEILVRASQLPVQASAELLRAAQPGAGTEPPNQLLRIADKSSMGAPVRRQTGFKALLTIAGLKDAAKKVQARVRNYRNRNDGPQA